MPHDRNELQAICENPNEEMMKKIQETLSKNQPDNTDELKSQSLSANLSQNQSLSGASKMPAYIGTKVVCAIPMDSYTFNVQHKGFKGDSETAPGYLVQYEDGYKSWSPKDVFERSYRLITNAERQLI